MISVIIKEYKGEEKGSITIFSIQIIGGEFFKFSLSFELS
jgi:hypothetical protein